MTVLEKRLSKDLSSISDTLDVVKYDGLRNGYEFKLRTKDGRPLNLLTRVQHDLLYKLGIIRDNYFDTELLHKKVKDNADRIAKRKANVVSKKNKKKEGDIF